MKKKILSVLFVLLSVSLIFTAFAGCIKPLTEAEKDIVGRYQLASMSVVGHPEITANSFERYTLEFKENRECDIWRIDTEEYKATATWEINKNGEVEIVTKIGRAEFKEVYTYNQGFLEGINFFGDDNGGTMEVNARFIKEQQ